MASATTETPDVKQQGTSAQDNGHLRIPVWFVRLATGVIGLAVPWAIWVTVTLITINVRVQDTSSIRTRLEDHLADPNLHYAGFGQIRGRLDAQERRIDRLEELVDRLSNKSRP